MTRVLLVRGGGGAPAGGAPSAGAMRKELGSIFPDGLPEGIKPEIAETRDEAEMLALIGEAKERADALVIAPDGVCGTDEELAALLRGAGVPTVQVHTRNVEKDGGAPPSAAGATAVIHGFEDPNLAFALAIKAAARLARRGG